VKKAIIVAAVMGIVSASAQTVLVRNKPVDLSPVVKWLEDREGERPMPHWKVIEIDTVLAKGWGGYRVAAKVEGKPGYEIVIQNIPADLLQVISADDATLKAMAGIEAKIEAIERLNRELERNKELTIREWSNAYEINAAQLKANDNALAELRAAHSELSQKLEFTTEGKESKILAFYTGQKVGKFEVWDCGVRSKVLTIEGLK
jgi:hypothetical protein